MQTQYLTLSESATLADAFAARCHATPDAPAYREYDVETASWRSYSWGQMAAEVARFRSALADEKFATGDRIGIMLKNCVQWIVADQAAHALGLVLVPIFVDDRADNVAYIVNDASIKLLLIDGEEHWLRLKPVAAQMTPLMRILCIQPVSDADESRLTFLGDWLPANASPMPTVAVDAQALATIVYTSGTTGKPKGVMLSHRNILANAQAGLTYFEVYPEDVFLSFLPLSHALERTCDYYLNVISGASMVFTRSITQLAEDFRIVKPTIVFSVPRIYERFYAAIQEQMQAAPPWRRALFNFAVNTGWARFEHHNGRGPWQLRFLLWPVLQRLVARKLTARMGGRLRFAIAGGAALSPDVARIFLGLGLPICQGYGMTESAPLLTVNLLHRNNPKSVGFAVPGVSLKLGEQNVLLAKGPNIMLGYWGNPQATAAVLSADGWLNTGDQARIDEEGYVYITGRIKEIIVLGNGEKVPPVDMEMAIQLDSLFEQVLIHGEAKPYLTALVVLNDVQHQALLAAHPANTPAALEKILLQRIAELIKAFPGYAQVRRVAICPDKWTVENGLITHTLKLKRAAILEKYAPLVDEMYKGHTKALTQSSAQQRKS